MVRVVQCLITECNTNIKRSDLWHERIEHVYMQTLTTMENINLVEGMDINGDHDLIFCDGRAYGKHHCTPFPLNGGSHAKEIIGL